MSNQKCGQEYIRRIHKVIDYIEQNIGSSLSIEELSKVAGFSKYHFSRIFQGILHESLAHYVNRIKMEKTLFILAHREDKNMTDIAYELGFSDSAVFSRAFKNYYGISPSEYRKVYEQNNKGPYLISDYKKKSDEKRQWSESTCPITGKITLESIEEKQVAYVRHIGTYESLAKEYGHLLHALFKEAQKQKLLVNNSNWILAMYHDNPEFGKEDQFRTSICLTVPDGIPIKEDGIISKMNLVGGLYAVGHFRIQQKQYPDAWNYMYQEWITGSGYVPRNYYPYEVYRNDASLDKEHMHEVDIYVPIEPMK